MRVGEITRQLLAGGGGAAVFLALFFAMGLLWWVSFVGGALVFGAVLLLVEARPRAQDVRVFERTTAADIEEAGRIMAQAAERLEHAAGQLGEGESASVRRMLDHLRSIRAQVLNDPRDYRPARRLIKTYLGQMVDTVERFADLSRKTRGRHEARLAPLGERIEGFVPVLERIDAACLENDFIGLETQMDALATQLQRGP